MPALVANLQGERIPLPLWRPSSSGLIALVSERRQVGKTCSLVVPRESALRAVASAHPMYQIAFNPMPTRVIQER